MTAETANETTSKPAGKTLYRFRITYSRGDALRYTGHLDTHLVWERTLRRAGVPLAYTQGFNPRPRLQMACALPLGFLSRCEMIDFWVELAAEAPAPEAATISALIAGAIPPGLEIQQVEAVDLSQPALQTLVQSAEYTAAPLDPPDLPRLHASVNAILDAETLPRERRGKPYDLRPLVEGLEVNETGSQVTITMRLAARDGATGRPEEVLDALGLDPAAFRVERTTLITVA